MKKYRRPSILWFRSARTPTHPSKSIWDGLFYGRHPSGRRFMYQVRTPYKQSRTLYLSPEGFFDYSVRSRKKKYGR